MTQSRLSNNMTRALDKREYLVIIRDTQKTYIADPSSEPSHASLRDSSDEGSQHMVSMRNKKNYHQIRPLI